MRTTKRHRNLASGSMLLEIINITHYFSSHRQILDNVSLNLKEGRIYALIGANGAGKTTLFNIITGYINPKKGKIKLDSKEINNLSSYQINRLGICRTFQDMRLISAFTVKDNVILAMKNHPTQNWFKSFFPEFLFKDKIRILSKKASEILEICLLNEVENSKASEISYGQQKLLSLACCIANDPKIFLLDEPVAGINSFYQEKIFTILKKLKQDNKTILLIEHNADFLRKVSDQFFFLSGGKITDYSSYNKFREDPEVLQKYL